MTNTAPFDDNDAEIADINRTTQDVLDKSDRIRAVLLGTQVDNLLLRLLEEYLVPKVGRKDRLLGGSGFAGTFSARIELAYRIGLVSPLWYHDLKIINEIRDAFAHGLSGLTLNDPALSSLCFDLKVAYGAFKGPPEVAKIKDNPQTRFVGTAVVLSSHLCLARKNLVKVTEIWKTHKQDGVQFSDPDFDPPDHST